MRGLGGTTVPGLDVEGIVRVLERVPVTLGLLYGTHARGEGTARSDVDIAVEFDESLSPVSVGDHGGE